MADATPALDAPARAALARLADIAIPEPVPWLPQTWGWAALGVAVLALAAWLLVRARRRRNANRYRAESLAELARLEAQLDDAGERARALMMMTALLKRVALAAWPRTKIAPLSSAAWVAFLRKHAGRAEISESASRYLDDGEYRAGPQIAATPEAAHAFARSVRDWIEEHRVSA